MTTATETRPRIRNRAHDPEPSAYEQVTRRSLEDLAAVVARIETKINGVVVGVLLAITVELLRLARL